MHTQMTAITAGTSKHLTKFAFGTAGSVALVLMAVATGRGALFGSAGGSELLAPAPRAAAVSSIEQPQSIYLVRTSDDVAAMQRFIRIENAERRAAGEAPMHPLILVGTSDDAAILRKAVRDENVERRASGEESLSIKVTVS